MSDPDLGEGLGEAQFARARVHAWASSRCYPRGRWRVPADPRADGPLGLVVVSGFLARRVHVGSYTAAELLGPGDVLAAWPQPGLEVSVAAEVSWAILQRARIATLDRGFMDRVAGWPEVTAALTRRLTWRPHCLSFQLARSALRRIEDRVILMLWQLADRWGTMTPEGVVLDVPLTRDLLASVVGARRASISVTVRRLVDRQQVRSPSTKPGPLQPGAVSAGEDLGRATCPDPGARVGPQAAPAAARPGCPSSTAIGASPPSWRAWTRAWPAGMRSPRRSRSSPARMTRAPWAHRGCSEGAVVALKLSHADIGELIGSERPTVSSRLRILADRGQLVRRADRTWLLPREPDGELGDLRKRVACAR